MLGRQTFLAAILATGIFLAGTIQAQELTARQWQEDLKYLHEVVTNERANLFDTITREEWEQQAKALHKKIPELQRHQIIVELSKLVAAFRIGHTQITIIPWRRHGSPSIKFHRYPLLTYVFSDGVYIRSAKEKYRDIVGARVVAIGKMPILEAMEAVRPVVPWENEQFFLSEIPYFLSCPEILHAQGVVDNPEETSWTIEQNGQQRTITLEAEPSGFFPGDYGMVYDEPGWLDVRDLSDAPTPLYLKNLDRNFYFEHLPEHNLVYVRHSQVRDEQDETIAQFFQRVMNFVEKNDVEKLVLDVRLNSGGNNYLNKPIIVGLIASRKINQPGRLFTIIGRRTFSAAQNLVNELEKYSETIFVGEPTSENVNFWGDVRQYELPNSGLPVRLSWLWWQDGDPRDDRQWLAPHIAVDVSFQDYKNNRDPVMEEILKYGEDQPLYQRMKNLYLSKKFVEAREAAQASAADPRRRYHDIEDDINRLGYDLLGENHGKAALEVFRLNTELYPHSANAFDSFAEGLWKAGQLDAAIENYQRAIKMDPDGVGANSRRMLEQVRHQIMSADPGTAHE